MQSNNNIYKNLPGNINNRGPTYPNTRMNNEFQSKKENYNNQQPNYNNMNYNYDQGFSPNQNINNNNNNFNYNKPSYNNNINNNVNMNVNNKLSYGNNNNFNNNLNVNNNNNNNKTNYADELNQAKESLKLLKLKMNNGGSIGGNVGNFGGNFNNDNNINIPNSNKNGQQNANYRKPFKPSLNANEPKDDFIDDGGNFNNINSNRGLGNIGANNNRSNIGSRLNSNANSKVNNMNKIGSNMGINAVQNKINSNYQDQTQPQRPNTRSKTNTTPMNSNTNNNNFSNAKTRVGTNLNSKLPSNPKQGKDNNLINKPNFQVEELEDDRPAFNPNGPKFDPYEDDNEFDEGEDDGTRIQCRQCGRKFNPEAIQKHEKVCKKVFCAERKKFDMKKKRILDSEHAMILKRTEVTDKSGKNSSNAKNNAKKAKWKKQSEEFRAILRGGKTGAGTTGPSSITDDYKHCNMCNRKYNENAYSKHLPTCERRTKEAMFKKGGAVSTQSNMNMPPGSRGNANYGNPMGGNRMGSNMMNNNNINSKYGRK